MSREEAWVKASSQLGDAAVIGVNYQKNGQFYVGTRRQNEWLSFGAGTSWEEAFLNLKVKKA